MDLLEYEDVVKTALARQRAAVRTTLWYAIGIFALGVAAIIITHLVPHTLVPDDQRLLMTVGGTFISTLSGLPILQLNKDRDRIGALEILDRVLDRASASQSPLDVRLEERIWKTLDRSLGI